MKLFIIKLFHGNRSYKDVIGYYENNLSFIMKGTLE